MKTIFSLTYPWSVMFTCIGMMFAVKCNHVVMVYALMFLLVIIAVLRNKFV